MKTISFFSYKGGSGRSSLIYNVLPFLADKLNPTPQNPIVLFDMDIDSMGLTYLFDDESAEAEVTIQKIIEGDYPGEDDEDPYTFYRAAAPIGETYGMDERSILLVPAARNHEEPGTFDTDDDPFTNLVRKLGESGCKAVIFDCPSGNQVTGRISREITDTYVIVMRITMQFRIGTYEYLKTLNGQVFAHDFIVVPNAVPNDRIVLDGAVYNYDRTRVSIKEELAHATNDRVNNLNTDMLEEGSFGIPEVKRLKLREDIIYNLPDNDKGEEEQKAIAQYRKLAEILSR